MSTPSTASDPLQASGVPHVSAEEAKARTAWFSEEVHPHGGQLKAYLRGTFPSVRDVDDVVQESYLRIWRAKAGRPIKSARAFLFSVARNLALDLVRRDKKSPVQAVGDAALLNVVEDRAGVVDRLSEQEKLLLLGQAIVALPDRMREIIILHKVKGLTQAEAALQLGVAEKTIENLTARAVQRLRNYFRERGIEYF